MLNTMEAKVDQVFQFVQKHKKSDIRACEQFICQVRSELPIRYAEPAAIFSYIEMGMYECAFTVAMELNANLHAYPIVTVIHILNGASLMNYTRRETLERANEYIGQFDVEAIGKVSEPAYVPKGWNDNVDNKVVNCHIALLQAKQLINTKSSNILIGDALRRNKKASDELSTALDRLNQQMGRALETDVKRKIVQ